MKFYKGFSIPESILEVEVYNMYVALNPGMLTIKSVDKSSYLKVPVSVDDVRNGSITIEGIQEACRAAVDAYSTNGNGGT